MSLGPAQEPSAAAGRTSLRDSLLPARYRVIGQVAVGGMASIWLAEDEVLGRQVAVKVLAEQLGSQPLFVRRFEREARTAAGLAAHPHVITVYDVGEHDRRPFIVMEYLPGGTLRDRIREGPVRAADALQWLGEAASALDFAHERGVIHRDVKPQNLLFDASGRLVVADLGIARAAYEDSLTKSGELLGSASYIAPEQAMGEPATAASDLYSLAVVAYELLAGSRPFAGSNFAEQALQQVESEPDPPSSRAPQLGTEVDAVLLRGLAKDPAERWPSAGRFVSALAQALERPAAAPERPLIDPQRTWPRADAIARHRRSPAQLAAAAALLVALAAIAAVVALGTGGDGGTSHGGRQGASAAKAKHRPEPERRAAPPAPAAAAAPRPAPAAGSGAALNDQGFRLMQAGHYDQAVPLLQQAVAEFPDGSSDLNYAYALYNLGRALRLSGRPAEAVPYLERRLAFPNQRGVVRRELAAARAAAG